MTWFALSMMMRAAGKSWRRARQPTARRVHRRLLADPLRVRRYRAGVAAELISVLVLQLRGYRILARRQRTPCGEIDVIAVRGRRLAFVEVKLRQSLDDAFAAITEQQSARVARAAESWLSRHPRYTGYVIGLDAVCIAPWRLPRYGADRLQAGPLAWSLRR